MFIRKIVWLCISLTFMLALMVGGQYLFGQYIEILGNEVPFFRFIFIAAFAIFSLVFVYFLISIIVWKIDPDNSKYSEYAARTIYAKEALGYSGTFAYHSSITEVVGGTITDNKAKKNKYIVTAYEQRGWEFLDYTDSISKSGLEISVKKTVLKRDAWGRPECYEDSDGDKYYMTEDKTEILKHATYTTHGCFVFSRDLMDGYHKDILFLESIELTMDEIEKEIYKKYNDWLTSANNKVRSFYDKEAHKMKLAKTRSGREGNFFLPYEIPLVVIDILALLGALGIFIPGLFLYTLSFIGAFPLIDLDFIGFNPVVRQIGFLCLIVFGAMFIIDTIIHIVRQNKNLPKPEIYVPDTALIDEFYDLLDEAMKLYKKLKIKPLSASGINKVYGKAPVYFKKQKLKYYRPKGTI